MDSQGSISDSSSNLRRKGGNRNHGSGSKSGSVSGVWSPKGEGYTENSVLTAEPSSFSGNSSSGSHNGRAREKRNLSTNHSADPRIYPTSAVRVGSSVAPGAALDSGEIRASSSNRENTQSLDNGLESGFVPYLPQDDAVLSGLGERHGGVDAEETQEVTDLLNQQLSNYLCLPPRQFWKRVMSDDSLFLFLDSYLHFRRRWFDNSYGSENAKVGIVAGDADLSRRVFMMLFRLSSNHDPGAPASESLSSKEHTLILKEKKILDVPKLMDICAIYGHDNPDLTSRLVSNVFKSQPGYAEEVAAYVPPLLQTILTMHERCFSTVEASSRPKELVADDKIDGRVTQELLEVVDYLTDVVMTLNAFVDAYLGAAAILITPMLPSQSLFLPVLATIHDSLLPIIRKGLSLSVDLSSNEDCTSGKSLKSCQGRDIRRHGLSQLQKLCSKLVDFVWQLLHCCYLRGGTEQSETMSSGGGSVIAYHDAANRGDLLLQAVVVLAIGPSHNHEEKVSAVGRLRCTGDLLRNIERRYGLYNQVQGLCQNGGMVLDDAQWDYLTALIGYDKVPNHGLISNVSSNLSNDGREGDEEAVIQQSKISQIKDLFPDYGNGFITACLDVYDNDPEKVIARILEGTLHQDLLFLDRTLATKPLVSEPGTKTGKDKGKAILTDQPLSSKGRGMWDTSNTSDQLILSKGKGLWENPNLSVHASSSLEAQVGGSVGISGSSNSNGESVGNMSNTGRYVRRLKSDNDSVDILDSKNRNDDVRAAVRAAAAQLEYEDEYDDSFDGYDRYVTDAGGIEEAESLSDLLNHSHGDLRGSSLGQGRQPSGAGQQFGVNSRGRGYSGGNQRSRLEVPKVSTALPAEGAVPDLQTSSISSQGRGGRGGRGRGRWKERPPKSQFYLKDGKLYSYKVAGAVGVASIEEAELLKKTDEDTIYGLGMGGNVPVKLEDSSALTKSSERSQNDTSDQARQWGVGADGGRGRGGSYNRGRGAPGSSHARRDSDNHNRKDGAMKKHFAWTGGF